MRKPGYYWVRLNKEWIIARWTSYDSWNYGGSTQLINDDRFEEIDERRIDHSILKNNTTSQLSLRSDKIELLEKYSIWLTKHGYMDTDWKDEPPYAIDEFLKTI